MLYNKRTNYFWFFKIRKLWGWANHVPRFEPIFDAFFSQVHSLQTQTAVNVGWCRQFFFRMKCLPAEILRTTQVLKRIICQNVHTMLNSHILKYWDFLRKHQLWYIFQYLDLKNAVEKCNHEEMKIAEDVFFFSYLPKTWGTYNLLTPPCHFWFCRPWMV